MNISICFTGLDAKIWIARIRKELPEASVSVWVPGASSADYAIVWNPPQQFINEQTKLKALFNIGAGVDNLLQLDIPESIKIIRLEDAGMSVQMTEYLCYSVFKYFREFENYGHDQKLNKWSYRKTRNRKDFTVGVMGLGNLGSHVVKALQLLEYPVKGYSRNLKEIEGVSCYNGKQGLTEFLNNTRILINLLPLTPETENILNYETMSQLSLGSYVINVARGAHLVDEDLVKLIDSGHLAGATLDVFRNEPLPANHIFWQNPKITITPHIAARASREESILQITKKIQLLQSGKTVTGIIDPQKGY
jgi:glyoxylate/hydroxypyruvate reductase A